MMVGEAKYKCNKCGRVMSFAMITGMPMKAVPCSDREGDHCKGNLVLQGVERNDKLKAKDYY
jgi:hypothetical protein